MNFHFKKDEGMLIVKVCGDLDHHNISALRTAIDDHIFAIAPKGLVLDFSELTLMDSSGIGLIMGRLRLMEDIGSYVCVSGASEPIKKIIELSGLSKMIALAESVRDGIKALGSISKIS